ncbi:hypothetical protein SAMN05216228_10264 [Rhizobium tibeticum]|uniref:Uncharacterized protein n=1 Tax=Rhizobium tibeticum TaxID=501024 RepID=A0A1H8SS12_9HYPH|nr:hypothetical protein [Rhizobium tibeticum]SEI13925.1 hypothetical protein RTCCBAU85039_5010 [Rhizobium tibeticum]SEO81377.1 hypothetical protein SAMN05216228_10264 [Rhizobium tibeticum]
MTDFDYVTSDEAVDIYGSTSQIFEGVLKEVRELCRKKPEATMSAGKVKIVNRVLTDMLGILKDEPTGKYLELLDDEALPQLSDAVLTMVQFETSMAAFRQRYFRYLHGKNYWITDVFVEEWNKLEAEDENEE